MMIIRYRNTLRDHRKRQQDETLRLLMRGLIVVGIAIFALILGMPR